MAAKDVLDLVKKNKVEIVDFKFVDVPGLWQHFSIPASRADGRICLKTGSALTARAFGDFSRSTSPTCC